MIHRLLEVQLTSTIHLRKSACQYNIMLQTHIFILDLGDWATVLHFCQVIGDMRAICEHVDTSTHRIMLTARGCAVGGIMRQL
jgi:hypothetical protein